MKELKSKKQKNTVTKLTNSLGDSYWLNAAKQIKWPIDIKERIINVPEKELDEAEQNLMVQHFRNNGFHIQSCIEVVHNKPYIAPVQDKPIFKPIKQAPVEETTPFKCEQKFLICSSECEVKIIRIEKGKVQMKYLNRNKPDLLSSVENLQKALRMGYWREI